MELHSMKATHTAVKAQTDSEMHDYSKAIALEAIEDNMARTMDGTGKGTTEEGEALLHPEDFDEAETESEASVIGPLEDDPINRKRGEGTKSTMYLILLTTCIAGLQIGWSVELSGLSPFLLSLGISKSLLALIWIAGPLSGALVQPYIGIKSDNLQSRWGRRRPFIIVGVASTGIAYIVLSHTRELVGGFLGIFGVPEDSDATQAACEVFATLCVYILDFSLNCVGASTRAYFVDCVPTHQQEDANAWASRIAGISSIVSYASGYVDLPEIFPLLGDTQFKGLCAIAFILMSVTCAISCCSIKERDSRTLGAPASNHLGVVAFFRSFYRSMRNLPPQIRGVCFVQIFSWIGWFPFLFYITTYIGGIYAEPYFLNDPNLSRAEIDAILEEGTRLGTYALLIFAVTTFFASVIIPVLVIPTYKAPDSTLRMKAAGRSGILDRMLSMMPLTRLQIKGLTLRRAWVLTHITFFILIWSTVFVSTITGATVLVGLLGIPWAVTSWAPFALISAEISRRDAIRRGVRAPKTPEEQQLAGGDEKGDQAGVVLGIHNVALSAPQILSTLISSVIFKVLQKPRGVPGDSSVGWTLRLLSICALIAAYVTIKSVSERDYDDDRD